MRTFEILTSLFLFFSVIRYIFPSRSKWVDSLPVLTVIFAIIHLIVEGYRWQMVPIYLTSFILLLLLIIRGREENKILITRIWLKVVLWLLLLVYLVGIVALPILLPIPQLPESHGPFQVGTFTMMLTDETRKELYSGDSTENRSIMVQVWYPADPVPTDKVAPWMDHADLIGPAISKYLGLPTFFLDHLIYVHTGAFLNAPVSHTQASYPVLLFSHGWNGFRAQNSFQAIQFASNGYIVVAIDHTYGAVLTVFPDGKLAYNNPNALPSNMADSEYLPIANKLVDQWSGDLGFVLDSLDVMNQSDTQHGMKGVLDLGKVGVFGHSTGGGATVEFCGRDSRCKAGIGMDAYLKPVSATVLELGLRQPFLFMFSETWSSTSNWQLFNQLYLNSDDANVMTILGTAHYDFSDLPILSPIAPQLGLKGPLNGKRVVEITSVYPLAFFDLILNGIPTTLLEGPSAEYPEVAFP